MKKTIYMEMMVTYDSSWQKVEQLVSIISCQYLVGFAFRTRLTVLYYRVYECQRKKFQRLFLLSLLLLRSTRIAQEI